MGFNQSKLINSFEPKYGRESYIIFMTYVKLGNKLWYFQYDEDRRIMNRIDDSRLIKDATSVYVQDWQKDKPLQMFYILKVIW